MTAAVATVASIKPNALRMLLFPENAALNRRDARCHTDPITFD
jgi:hypothetical protein